MKSTRQSFLNFQVDHMTLLLQPQDVQCRVRPLPDILGVTPEDILYNKRKAWVDGGARRVR